MSQRPILPIRFATTTRVRHASASAVERIGQEVETVPGEGVVGDAGADLDDWHWGGRADAGAGKAEGGARAGGGG